jgi:hypothetical protein
VPDISYEIHPANIPGTTEFNAFTAQNKNSKTALPICIVQYKITFEPANTTALALLTKEATATAADLVITSTFALTDTAPKIKISFAFTDTVHHNLVGDHVMKLVVSLRDYPTFDYFMKKEFDFKLTITSACATTIFN